METENTKIKGSYKFSEITYKILRKITNITLEDRNNKFEEWFNYSYKLTKEEEFFLQNLLKRESKYFQYYKEETQKAKFIIPLLNKINFVTEKFKDWYEYEISGIVNGYKLSGRTDFMLASGTIEPEKPYFFIQEFKPSKTNSNPDFQVLAEMLVAMEINKKQILCGVYNIGKNWNFIILEKKADNKYHYYESESYNCLKIDDLKQIYINLQAVKHKYCIL